MHNERDLESSTRHMQKNLRELYLPNKYQNAKLQWTFDQCYISYLMPQNIMHINKNDYIKLFYFYLKFENHYWKTLWTFIKEGLYNSKNKRNWWTPCRREIFLDHHRDLKLQLNLFFFIIVLDEKKEIKKQSFRNYW